MKFTPTTSVTFEGKTQPISDWASDLGMLPENIYSRLRLGWTIEQALSTPVRNLTSTVDVNGLVLGFQEALNLLGISHQAIYKAAKKNKRTPAEEIQHRFSLNPRLLDTNSNPK